MKIKLEFGLLISPQISFLNQRHLAESGYWDGWSSKKSFLLNAKSSNFISLKVLIQLEHCMNKGSMSLFHRCTSEQKMEA